MNYTYIVECADNTLYTGWTNDIEKRMEAHNSGNGAKYTKPRTRRPVKLVYLEEFAAKEDAMKREFRIKQLSRSDKELLINSPENGLRWKSDCSGCDPAISR